MTSAAPTPPRPTALLPSAALGRGAVAAVEVGERRLAVWRCADGTVAAVDARCPHQWADLAQLGDVEGCELVCASHGWRFAADGTGTKVSVLGRRDRKGDAEAFPCWDDGGEVVALLP